MDEYVAVGIHEAQPTSTERDEKFHNQEIKKENFDHEIVVPKPDIR